MTAHKHLNGPAFLQKLKLHGLRTYLNKYGHSRKTEIEAILSNDTPYHLLCAAVYDVINDSDNPEHENDLDHFAMMNDLASDKGRLIIQQLIEEKPLDISYDETTTDHNLALKLLIHCKEALLEAHSLLNIDYEEGWVNYLGKNISETVEDLETAKNNFCESIRRYLKNKKIGNKVDCHIYRSRGRIILDFYNEGAIRRYTDFSADGKIKASSRAAIHEAVLVYFPGSGHLKVRTPRGQSEFNEALHQEFASHFLKSPEALLEQKSAQSIFLDDLLGRVDFPIQPGKGIKTARLTSIKLFPNNGTNGYIYLHNKDGRIP